MYDLSLNYSTSLFNPLLKAVIAIIFVLVAYAYFMAGQGYKGRLKKVTNLLVWMAVVGALASFFRYLGHGTMLGFTSEYSLKWFQSLGYVVQASLLTYAAKTFYDIAKM